MSERVELARPFAVVEERTRYAVDYHGTEDGARSNAERLDRAFPKDAPHIVVRLTAERVEEPIPEAKSGWEWRTETEGKGDVMLCRGVGGEFKSWAYARLYGKANDWRDDIPPCDHAHVAALLRREGVEAWPTG